MLTVEVDNRSGVEVDEPGAVELAGKVRSDICFDNAVKYLGLPKG